MAYGFKRRAARKAYKESKYDADDALDYLLEHYPKNKKPKPQP